MVEVLAAIPPDVLEAVFPAAEAAAELSAAGVNPAPPVEEVSWFLLPYRSCFVARNVVVSRHSARIVLSGLYTQRLVRFHGLCRLSS